MPLTFVRLYFLNQGYRDGIHGVIACGLNSLYQFVQKCKIWEKRWHWEQARSAPAVDDGAAPGPPECQPEQPVPP